MIKITYRDSDLKVDEYIRSNFKIGDLISVSGIRKALGLSDYTVRMSLRWLAKFGKIVPLERKDWIRVRKRGPGTKTYKIVGEI